MKVTIQKLGITIEDESPSLRAMSGDPIAACPNGYAVYAYRDSRNLQRVGGATCVFPHPGHSASSAGSYITISSALSSSMSDLRSAHPQLAELRFAVCCPTSSSISLAKTAGGAAASRTARKPQPRRSRGKA